MSHKPALYALLAGLLTTVVIVGLEVASPRGALTTSLRAAGASVTGPVLATMAAAFPDPAASEVENARLRAQLALAEHEVRVARDSTVIAGADHIARVREDGHRVVLARVVAVGALGPAGPERLTLNVGADGGIAEDQSVVSAHGLVGRTVRVGATTSDVLILGAPDLIVAARGAGSGMLGTVAPAAGGDGTRDPGELTFTTISFGEPIAGEQLLTVGSPDDSPFVAGQSLGTVTRIDPATGQVSSTAAVAPGVDIARLDIVAVIVPEGSTDAD